MQYHRPSETIRPGEPRHFRREGRFDEEGSIKRGCLGCLVVVALLFLAFTLWAVVGLATAPDAPEIEDVSAAHPLVGQRPAPVAGGEIGDLDGVEAATINPAEFGPNALRPDPVTLDLDVSLSNFVLVAGPPGEPLRVEARYDTNAFRFDESYDAEKNVYKIRMRMPGFPFRVYNSKGFENEIRVTVPRDHPFRLDGRVRLGESDIDLGGLWITDVDLEFGTGEHDFRVSEPLREPVERMRFDGSIGEVALVDLGNASPSEVDIQHSIGEVRIRLDGEWKNDALLRLQCGIGDCRLARPTGVNFEVAEAKVSLGERRVADQSVGEVEAGQPTVTVAVRQTLGELRIE